VKEFGVGTDTGVANVANPVHSVGSREPGLDAAFILYESSFLAYILFPHVRAGFATRDCPLDSGHIQILGHGANKQLTEARRAFWAGSGMMLRVLVGEVQNQPDESAAASIVSDLMQQVDVFFAAELALQEQQLQDAKKSKILLPPGLKILK